MNVRDHYDVVIVGAGLAGLSLARQILLESPDRTILILDKRATIPPNGQKVGEATVQVSGYYCSKVLELEEYLFREHFMKYNLRFYWKTTGRDNSRFEDYCQCYLRPFSNVASYQLDRNKIEGELLRRNLLHPSFTFLPSATGLDVTLSDAGPHAVRFKVPRGEVRVTARWVVDTSGRARVLARKAGLERRSQICHGAFWLWVDGLLNIETLTDSTPRQIRLNPARRAIGHLPFWLATNHFCGEGFWFWVIPLQGKTSLGLVFDSQRVRFDEVSSPEKLIAWICREFPLFARDLPGRRVLHFGCYKDFSLDCAQTIDKSRWAMAGEAGRFTDPLYSPGGDLIAIYNTLLTDAILTGSQAELATKAPLYEQLMQTVYEAYIPSYAVSYDALGDQEAMTLKYVWELAVYFSFYVFPFINELFVDRRFAIAFLSKFARLGRLNKSLQAFIAAYYHWKKAMRPRPERPVFFDFTDIGYLRNAEKAFYKVGVSVDQAREELDAQLANVIEFARFEVAHIHASVVGEERALRNRRFIESLDLERLEFDPDAMRARYAMYADCTDEYPWSCDPSVLDRFRAPAAAVMKDAGAEITCVPAAPQGVER